MKIFSRLLLLMLCVLVVRPATAQSDRVTAEGFDDIAKDATLYVEIPLQGVLGEDAPAESIKQTLNAAGQNKLITHAVFMVDSFGGSILDRSVVAEYNGKLEVTAVVRNALTTAAFPVFFADHIFMTRDGLIGGLPLHLYVPPGSEEVTAKQVGIFSSMAASAADVHGHNPDIVRAMINEKESLYYWRVDGRPVLSNTKPENTKNLDGFRKVKPALPGTTLTLDTRMAKEFGFAEPIDDFDAFIVGEFLGKKNWRPANNFGRVANEIGSIVAELEPLREEISAYEKELPEFRNGNDIPADLLKEYREYKNSLEAAVEAMDLINESLAKLYEVHPERHVYFLGTDGKTILADPAKWEEDVKNARNIYTRANSGLEALKKGFIKIGGDEEAFYDLVKRMKSIKDHLDGITQHGNATYWHKYATPDLGDDVYG